MYKYLFRPCLQHCRLLYLQQLEQVLHRHVLPEVRKSINSKTSELILFTSAIHSYFNIALYPGLLWVVVHLANVSIIAPWDLILLIRIVKHRFQDLWMIHIRDLSHCIRVLFLLFLFLSFLEIYYYVMGF